MIKTNKCKAAAWGPLPSRSSRNDGKEMEEEGPGSAGWILRSAARSKGKQGPGSSSLGFTLLAHTAWPHTDFQEWQRALAASPGRQDHSWKARQGRGLQLMKGWRLGAKEETWVQAPAQAC